MWIKPVITKDRLEILCRVLINCVKRWNYIIPTRLNELYEISKTDPERALRGLCKDLESLEVQKPLTQRVKEIREVENNRRENNGIQTY